MYIVEYPGFPKRGFSAQTHPSSIIADDFIELLAPPVPVQGQPTTHVGRFGLMDRKLYLMGARVQFEYYFGCDENGRIVQLEAPLPGPPDEVPGGRR